MFERIILITKKTALEDLLLRHHSMGAVRFFLESRGASLEAYKLPHDTYHRVREMVVGALPREMPHEVLPREHVPNFLFRPKDLVLVLGEDGLCANTVKYTTEGQPILAINPDEENINGVLVRFSPEAAIRRLPNILEGAFAKDTLVLAKATTNEGVTLYGVNDIKVGRLDQVAARYTIEWGGQRNRQISSGVVISTGVGSTGWINSIITGAVRIATQFLNLSEDVKRELWEEKKLVVPFPWDVPSLLFAVQEPFQSKNTQTDIAIGRIRGTDTIRITSEMPEGGAIFSDGITEDAATFNAGVTVEIGIAERTGTLIRP